MLNQAVKNEIQKSQKRISNHQESFTEMENDELLKLITIHGLNLRKLSSKMVTRDKKAIREKL